MTFAILRDRCIGRRIRRHGGTRPLHQAEQGGGTHFDNVTRMADWRNRYARIPIEHVLGATYIPIPRCRSLVVVR